ncbi:MAG: AAA family ATPase [gamma proteobacterium symbiont of Bathyaustriella thionipta]|nr:AAA family ATPase [gamma proteobacterium symbiont of Bathyaustriella thionipta]MCU7949464.1 AAA family ATPase [gamma proteobacterium symbiont of Bathyaustriella thionipta]MCU7953117.1 AAA family ATPase [gamma proteobacterium symbiont of Bathyaustriella thionipta]MCU7956051.1 AAA family ATPase [gamma proteobacterium symbiont of Bathyaustriella thionipta]
MIIHSIHAKNVLKYEQLDLQDLPQRGVIAISGFNESGKSTIGETICFALFGRTFSVNEEELDKIIRWGESDCSVTIQFSNHKADEASDELYAITRMLDCDGNHSAKLYKVYNEENPIARGIDRVEEALFDLTSIEFEEFIESFYLAQREITTPHPHSYALKTMAGIATMEHCDNGIHHDIEQDIAAADELASRITQIEEEVQDLDIEQGHLDSQSSQHEEALQTKTQTDEELANYQSALDEYNEAAPRLSQYLSKNSRASFWRFIFFIMAAVALALWWILIKMPDAAIHEQLAQFVQSNLPQFTAQHYPYLLYAGGGSVFLFLFFWAAGISHKGNIERLSQAGANLAEKMRSLDKEENEERSLQINLVASSQASDKQLNTITEADLSFFDQQQDQQAELISQLSGALVIERERVNRAAELQEKINTLQSQIDDKESRNQTRELATELLTGAARHLSKRFNHIIRDHVGKTLPLFTQNRYEHLQIDEDLSVRVFSNEKHDFMDLDEISSGTQRQIMLAVRLALSQEMVSRKVHTQQFLILDEPFAFFDEQRTEQSLSVLPELSNDLPQIWIIAQSFPDNMNFEHSIYCERDVSAKTS